MLNENEKAGKRLALFWAGLVVAILLWLRPELFLTPNALASLRQDVGRVELALSGKGGTQGTLEVKGENVKVETEQNGEFKSSKLTFSQGLFYNSYSVFITPKFASAPDQKTRERESKFGIYLHV